jgi:hypothetical protein
MSKSETVPWKRLTAEGFVVVVSILLAFGIDAWWDGYRDSERQRSQLAAMREEFSDSLNGLDEVLDSIQQHADGVDELILLLNGAGVSEVEVPGRLLGYAIGWRTSDVSTSTLDALIASGDLSFVANDALRKSLAGLPAFLLNLTEDEILAMEFAESIMSTFLAREGLAEAAYANRPGLGRPGAPEFVSVTPSAEFVGLLMARRVHFQFALDGIPSVKTYLERLIEEIDRELGRKN